MAKKPLKRAERIEVTYSEKHWDLLKELRVKAMKIMEALNQFHLYSVVHGSIARGDVSEKSDIDVFVPDPPSSFIVETALGRAGVSVSRRLLVQATPHYAVKGYLEINKQLCVSFPLLKLRPLERDFYKFGGEASLPMLRKNTRVLGVDKRLMLIEPTKEGHVETSIVRQEENIAGLLGVSMETVLDRVHALLRRNEIGRTGVFIEREHTRKRKTESLGLGASHKDMDSC